MRVAECVVVCMRESADAGFAAADVKVLVAAMEGSTTLRLLFIAGQ